MDILVSGTSSGLGKYLKEVFNADAYDRSTLSAPKSAYNVIIHCAFNITSDLSSHEMPLYVEDTVGLTEWLLDIPHKQFIYISSAAVYPADDQLYSEECEFNAGDIKNLYGFMKLVCEGIVRLRSENSLILRPTYMIGPYPYRNCLIKLLTDHDPHIVLPADSRFNYILHEDVAEFVQIALQRELKGIYNLAASGDTTLGKVARHLKRNATFGEHVFKTSRMDNRKAAAICPAFNRTSLENASFFYENIKNCRS